MNELSIFTSTSKLARKFILPIVALILLYFFIVVPDEDIGVGSGGFFITMTVILFGAMLALISVYFYQLYIAKKKPVICINSEYVIFPRHKLKFPLTGEYVFATRTTSHESPPTTGAAFDIILDRKESYLHVWKGDKRIREIHITWINMDENVIAALCNLLAQQTSKAREALLREFYESTIKAHEKAKERIFFQGAGNDEGSYEGYVPVTVDLSHEHKKWAIIAACALVMGSAVPFFVQETAYQITFWGTFLLALIGSLAISAIIALLVALIPFRGLEYKQKYLRAYFLSITGHAVLGLFSIFFIKGEKDTRCHEEIVLRKLKSSLVSEVTSSSMYDPLFYERPDSLTAVAAVDEIDFRYIDYAGEVNPQFRKLTYNIYDPKADACLCQAKITFKDNDTFLARIRSKVSSSGSVVLASKPDVSKAHLDEYEDYESFSFSFIIVDHGDELEVRPHGYQIKDLISDYIRLRN